MIVKFHPRGRGGGAGPVDYLLGKDRQRHRSAGEAGRSQGAYRRLALRKKVHIRRPVLCRKGFTARAARKADGEL
ncbi:TPA: hypothetical protein ACI7M7_004937 [Escherichia coli]